MIYELVKQSIGKVDKFFAVKSAEYIIQPIGNKWVAIGALYDERSGKMIEKMNNYVPNDFKGQISNLLETTFKILPIACGIFFFMNTRCVPVARWGTLIVGICLSIRDPLSNEAKKTICQGLSLTFATRMAFSIGKAILGTYPTPGLVEIGGQAFLTLAAYYTARHFQNKGY